MDFESLLLSLTMLPDNQSEEGKQSTITREGMGNGVLEEICPGDVRMDGCSFWSPSRCLIQDEEVGSLEVSGGDNCKPMSQVAKNVPDFSVFTRLCVSCGVSKLYVIDKNNFVLVTEKGCKKCGDVINYLAKKYRKSCFFCQSEMYLTGSTATLTVYHDCVRSDNCAFKQVRRCYIRDLTRECVEKNPGPPRSAVKADRVRRSAAIGAQRREGERDAERDLGDAVVETRPYVAPRQKEEVPPVPSIPIVPKFPGFVEVVCSVPKPIIVFNQDDFIYRVLEEFSSSRSYIRGGIAREFVEGDLGIELRETSERMGGGLEVGGLWSFQLSILRLLYIKRVKKAHVAFNGSVVSGGMRPALVVETDYVFKNHVGFGPINQISRELRPNSAGMRPVVKFCTFLEGEHRFLMSQFRPKCSWVPMLPAVSCSHPVVLTFDGSSELNTVNPNCRRFDFKAGHFDYKFNWSPGPPSNDHKYCLILGCRCGRDPPPEEVINEIQKCMSFSFRNPLLQRILEETKERLYDYSIGMLFGYSKPKELPDDFDRVNFEFVKLMPGPKVDERTDNHKGKTLEHGGDYEVWRVTNYDHVKLDSKFYRDRTVEVKNHWLWEYIFGKEFEKQDWCLVSRDIVVLRSAVAQIDPILLHTCSYEQSKIAARMVMKNQQNINITKEEIPGYPCQSVAENSVAFAVAQHAYRLEIEDDLRFL